MSKSVREYSALKRATNADLCQRVSSALETECQSGIYSIDNTLNKARLKLKLVAPFYMKLQRNSNCNNERNNNTANDEQTMQVMRGVRTNHAASFV